MGKIIQDSNLDHNPWDQDKSLRKRITIIEELKYLKYYSTILEDSLTDKESLENLKQGINNLIDRIENER